MSGAMTSALAQDGRVRVVNAGVPGENSTELRARFAASLAEAHPRFVVIYTGMNDAANDRKFVPVETFRANLVAMLEASQHAHVKAVLVTIHHVDEARVLRRHTPESYGDRSPNRRIDELNEVVTTLARERGLALADFNRALEQAGGANEGLSTDGVHLTTTAYGLLASAVRVALPRSLQPGTTVLCVGDSLTFGIGVRPVGAGESGADGSRYPTYPAQLEKQLNKQGVERWYSLKQTGWPLAASPFAIEFRSTASTLPVRFLAG
jgi:lysophospholipase L1-like esterase